MKLTKVHITNFRCIDDSDEFTVNQTTCLVGKNESGKTALLRSLEYLNPLGTSSAAYDQTRNYPRRFLTDYKDRHGDEEALVARTVWRLDKPELDALEAEFGPSCLTSEDIEISKYYGSTTTQWAIQTRVPDVLEHLAGIVGIKGAKLKQAQPHFQSEKGFAKFVASLDKDKQVPFLALGAKIAGYRKGRINSKAVDILAPFQPEFLYVSSYDRMPGKVSVNDLIEKTNNSRISNDEAIFLDLLAYAGATLKEFQNPQNFEALRARVEAASIKISRQIFEYWTQNKNLKVQLTEPFISSS